MNFLIFELNLVKVKFLNLNIFLYKVTVSNSLVVPLPCILSYHRGSNCNDNIRDRKYKYLRIYFYEYQEN